MYILQIHFGPSLKHLTVLQLTATLLDFVEEEVGCLMRRLSRYYSMVISVLWISTIKATIACSHLGGGCYGKAFWEWNQEQLC
jgi:hypothetical protein